MPHDTLAAAAPALSDAAPSTPSCTPSPAAGWLAVQAADQALLLPLAQCGEIYPQASVHPVAHAAAWLAGVAALRGELCAVTDLGAFLGLGAPLPTAAAAPLVALHPSLGLVAALRVQRLLGLRDSATLEADPDLADAASLPAWAASRWLDRAGQAWLALDCAAWAHDPRFLDVARTPATTA